ILPIIPTQLPILPDRYLHIQFPTPPIKLTPPHHPNHFEIPHTHHLQNIILIHQNPKINHNPSHYPPLHPFQC
ncbi:hypothetical protein, partial [Staphylococcus hominis]|uniref:hypothetical protein n=1 Tax=Staphylococcus hominis TaxID=1290 RepID=UPI001C92D477